MPSSISSSEPAGIPVSETTTQRSQSYAKAIVLAFLCFVVLLGLLETGMRAAFDRFSRIGGRIAGEYALARSIAPAKPGDPPAILVVGNSLLLEGVDFPDLQQRVTSARVSRFVVENTNWLDWYYGIRRLLAEGTRPKAIILCMNTPQLMSSAIRGEYSSYYLFQARDIPAVARDAQYNLTRASGLVFAHYSRFYADRNNLRSFLLNRLDGAYVDMMFQMTVRPAPASSGAEIERVAEVRLAALKAAGDATGVRCILLIPPGFTSGEKEIRAAADRVGAEVWVPIPQNALPHSDYKDDYHLNQHGAAIFTEALASRLKNLAAEK
jgi:hypothetical protein